MNALIVDDSSTMRKIVSLALGGAGYSTQEAENGRIGLEKTMLGGVDLVLLDINMPEMNGLEYLEAKSKISSIAKVPVVMLTTQDEKELQEKALSLGAKAYLVKPFKKDDLVATLNKIL
ncbi:MAG TPA: response regulator [Spirochaetia bacterium]|nr:response regulator [Spirochaetaceae bacterium]HPE89608.1 response regulator [Spirochaetales bacterium]HRW23823.1 response regulator [Spirochaetia bacterium]